MTVQEQETIQKPMSVAEVYKEFKHDLKLCINYLEHGKAEYVAMYFGTTSRNKIEELINNITVDFPDKWIADIQKLALKIFTYFTKEEWQQKKSKTNSKKGLEN